MPLCSFGANGELSAGTVGILGDEMCKGCQGLWGRGQLLGTSPALARSQAGSASTHSHPSRALEHTTSVRDPLSHTRIADRKLRCVLERGDQGQRFSPLDCGLRLENAELYVLLPPMPPLDGLTVSTCSAFSVESRSRRSGKVNPGGPQNPNFVWAPKLSSSRVTFSFFL